jgi:hypothetical protein
MIVGTAKTSHMLLLFTSVVLISIGVYGTIVSKEYGCDEGINIKLYHQTGSIVSDEERNKCLKDFSYDNLSKQSKVNKLDKCLNDHGKGNVRCMEGGLFGLSITSIIIGVLMLLLSSYLLFM